MRRSRYFHRNFTEVAEFRWTLALTPVIIDATDPLGDVLSPSGRLAISILKPDDW